jgi:hypothetical protein
MSDERSPHVRGDSQDVSRSPGRQRDRFPYQLTGNWTSLAELMDRMRADPASAREDVRIEVREQGIAMAGVESHSPPHLPSGSASEEEWAAFKNEAYVTLVRRIKLIDREFARDPQGRIERVRELRREHHLIVIGDRIRRAADTPFGLSGAELRKAAEYVLDRPAYLASKAAEWTEPRSRAEELMMNSARVNWHKLMRKAGSPAELRGGYGIGKPEFRGITSIFKKIAAPGLPADKRAELLRDHIEERVQQLVNLAREVQAATYSKLPRSDRLLIRDLELVLDGIRRSNRLREQGPLPRGDGEAVATRRHSDGDDEPLEPRDA